MKPLRVTGDKKQGYRIAVPAIVQRAEAYTFEYGKGGKLIYTPVRP